MWPPCCPWSKPVSEAGHRSHTVVLWATVRGNSGRQPDPNRCFRQHHRHRHPAERGLRGKEFRLLQNRYSLHPGGHHPGLHLHLADLRRLKKHPLTGFSGQRVLSYKKSGGIVSATIRGQCHAVAGVGLAQDRLVAAEGQEQIHHFPVRQGRIQSDHGAAYRRCTSG